MQNKAPQAQEIIVRAGLDKKPAAIIQESKSLRSNLRRLYCLVRSALIEETTTDSKEVVLNEWGDGIGAIAVIGSIFPIVLVFGFPFLLFPQLVSLSILSFIGFIKFDKRKFTEEDVAKSDKKAILRRHYYRSLAVFEDQLIGPNSDWCKAKLDLEKRIKALKTKIAEADIRINQATLDGNVERKKTILLVRDRALANMRDLNQALTNIDALIEKTQNELRLCHAYIESISSVYSDHQFIQSVDESLLDNEAAIAYVDELCEKSHEKISKLIFAVASSVLADKLVLESGEKTEDISLYLERVEVLADRIVSTN